MRYYDIRITDKNGKLVVPKPFQGLNGQVTNGTGGGTLDTGSTYTNFVGGQILAGGLDIGLQIRQYTYGNAAGAKDGSLVTIYGVSLAEVGQAVNLNDMNITVKAGMQKGLPLAKPQQAGVLTAGKIFQSIGNWENIDKTITFLFYDSPKIANFQFVWRKGSPLKDAIQTTLAAAMPDAKINIFISPDLVALKDEGATYANFAEFAQAIKERTKSSQFNGIATLTGNKYAGVQMSIQQPTQLHGSSGGVQFPQPGGSVSGTPSFAGKAVLVQDMTQPYQESRLPNSPLLLNFEDFVGQPSWIEPAVIRFKMVMRGDIRVGDFVKLPQTPFGNNFITLPGQSAYTGAPSRNQLAFQSSYFIRRVDLYGRLRQPDASAWVSVFEGVFTKINLSTSGLSGGGGTAP